MRNQVIDLTFHNKVNLLNLLRVRPECMNARGVFFLYCFLYSLILEVSKSIILGIAKKKRR